MGAGNQGGLAVIFYHFCREQDMRGIRNKGITKGMIAGEELVSKGKGRGSSWVTMLIPGWQWITLDGDHDRQSWATRITIPYDRTEYRWTIDMPEKERNSLYDRERLMALYPGTEQLFDGWKGSEHWMVYRGTIPKKWLVKLEHWNKATGTWEEVPYGR